MTSLTLASTLAAMALAAVGYAAAPAESPTVTMKGKPVTLVGQLPKTGEAAPAFTAVANDMSAYQFTPKSGQVYILSAVPSVDTPVCATETRRFNEEAAKLGTGVSILTISMDLPFAQRRWCAAEGIKAVQTVSDFREHSFANAYGVLIKELGLLARVVFVVDKNGKISYVQVVPEVAQEPDYAAVLTAAKKAAE